MALRDAEEYLAKGPPFVGTSNFKHRAQVRGRGGKWDPSRKAWVAPTETVLFDLIDSALWSPLLGELRPEAAALLGHVRSMRDREQERLRASEHKREAEANADRKRAAELQMLEMLPDEPGHLEYVRARGITDAQMQASTAWLTLGPRGGISIAERLIRGVELNITTWKDLASGRFPSRQAPSPPSSSAAPT